MKITHFKAFILGFCVHTDVGLIMIISVFEEKQHESLIYVEHKKLCISQSVCVGIYNSVTITCFLRASMPAHCFTHY